MPDSKISALPAATTPLAGTEQVPIVQGGETKRVSASEFGGAISLPVPLIDGGTGASLTDPNADRIFFWDDSAGSTAFLAPGTGLAISGTTITVDQAALTSVKPTESIIIACSDETTALTTGTAKVAFRMPYAFTLTAVRASVTTAPTGAVLTVDINEAGASILSTKLTIDATEKTSTTAATAAVISDSSLADDAEMTIDIDTVGSTIAGAGLKVVLIGTRT